MYKLDHVGAGEAKSSAHPANNSMLRQGGSLSCWLSVVKSRTNTTPGSNTELAYLF